MDTVVSLHDLSITYGSGDTAVAAVQDVDLDIHHGEILGLAGESGCGKSTLGLSLLRLLPHSAKVTGEIRYADENLLTAKWSRMRAVRWSGISMVFQGAMSALNPVQTIGHQLNEAIALHDPHSQATARSKDLLERVGLGARRFGAYPHELSGGQRQRVMIAMALACDPELIIADEPTTALDVMVQAQVLELLTSLVRANNISVLLISHDLSVLARTCDRVAVMYSGRLVETSPAERLFSHPSHPYSRALARAFPTIGDPSSRMHPRGLPGYPAIPHPGQTGCPFAPRCAYALDACKTTDVKLWPVDDGTRAACIRHLPQYPPLPPETAPADDGQPRSSTSGPAADEEVLAARDVHLVYPARGKNPPAVAVDGVDLSLRAHEIVALIGESGCGKSTLAQTLVGLLRPTSGTIEYDGKRLRYAASALRTFRRHVQMVLQDPAGALNPRQDIYDAVAEGLRVHHDMKNLEHRVEEAMETAGLHPAALYEDRLPYELSGGQLQRAVIAGALTLQPAVIVADEPVSALDASARGEILALILRLRDRLGVSALIVSHDLGLAWNIADRVAVMYLGRIVEIGSTETLMLSPQHPYTRALLSVLVNRKDKGTAPIILQGEGPDPTHIPTGCRFRPRCPLFAMLPPDGPGRQRCNDVDPQLRKLKNGTEVACHHVSESLAETSVAPAEAAQ
ncbi:MAG: ABC transporter ATP-binding protein [Pseudoclavibacter sp.]